ncbi:MAG: hypothetical protein ACKOT0_06610 [bacterium]
MKLRQGIVACAVGALAFGMLTQGPASAAPALDAPSAGATAEKPSGRALVRIDTGKAITKLRSDGTYRISVPKGAYIGWMGEVDGLGGRIGTFTPNGLVGAWKRMGHQDGRRTVATITWMKSGAEHPTFRPVKLGKPHFGSDGLLTFVARVPKGMGGLPRKLVDFSININRAQATPRDWYFPTAGPLIALDATHNVQGFLTSETGGEGQWTGTDDGSRSPCQEVTGIPDIGEAYILQDILCAGLIIHAVNDDGDQSFLQLLEDGSLNVAASFSYDDGSTTQGAAGAAPRAGAFLQFWATLIYCAGHC